MYTVTINVYGEFIDFTVSLFVDYTRLTGCLEEIV